jgi:mono/diheme cytochrome c family protein
MIRQAATSLVLVMLAGAAAAAAEPAQLTALQERGKALFEQTCVYCHGERGWATRDLGARLGAEKAVLSRRDDLDPRYVRFVIRHGLNNMPAYTPTDLDADQIGAVIDYLTRNKPAAH